MGSCGPCPRQAAAAVEATGMGGVGKGKLSKNASIKKGEMSAKEKRAEATKKV